MGVGIGVGEGCGEVVGFRAEVVGVLWRCSVGSLDSLSKSPCEGHRSWRIAGDLY